MIYHSRSVGPVGRATRRSANRSGVRAALCAAVFGLCVTNCKGPAPQNMAPAGCTLVTPAFSVRVPAGWQIVRTPRAPMAICIAPPGVAAPGGEMIVFGFLGADRVHDVFEHADDRRRAIEASGARAVVRSTRRIGGIELPVLRYSMPHQDAERQEESVFFPTSRRALEVSLVLDQQKWRREVALVLGTVAVRDPERPAVEAAYRLTRRPGDAPCVYEHPLFRLTVPRGWGLGEREGEVGVMLWSPGLDRERCYLSLQWGSTLPPGPNHPRGPFTPETLAATLRDVADSASAEAPTDLRFGGKSYSAIVIRDTVDGGPAIARCVAVPLGSGVLWVEAIHRTPAQLAALDRVLSGLVLKESTAASLGFMRGAWCKLPAADVGGTSGVADVLVAPLRPTQPPVR